MNRTRRNIIKYVVPAILTNASFFLFTVIDGIFVGNGVGENGVGAVNLAFPFIMIAMALATMTSIGGVTVTAIRFGRGDDKGANEAFMHSFFMTFLLSLIFSGLGMFAAEPISIMMGADESYLPLVREYLFYYSAFLVPGLLQINLMNFCRNDGSPGLVGKVTVGTTVLNIFLDWLFVFPLHMGLMGAACATGISETVNFLFILSHFVLKKGKLRIRPERFDLELVKKIFFRGTPEMIAQFAGPVMVICYNWVLITSEGEIGVNAFSIIDYVASFTLAVMFGASGGYQPLFGNAYGRKDEGELEVYLKSSLRVVIIGSIACISVIIALSRPICAMFGPDAVTLDYTVSKMPLYAWGFVPTGINAIISAYFYSTKQSGKAIVINIFRCIVFNALIITMLPKVFGAGIVWTTFGIYESLVSIISVSMLISSRRKGVVFR